MVSSLAITWLALRISTLSFKQQARSNRIEGPHAAPEGIVTRTQLHLYIIHTQERAEAENALANALASLITLIR